MLLHSDTEGGPLYQAMQCISASLQRMEATSGFRPLGPYCPNPGCFSSGLPGSESSAFLRPSPTFTPTCFNSGFGVASPERRKDGTSWSPHGAHSSLCRSPGFGLHGEAQTSASSHSFHLHHAGVKDQRYGPDTLSMRQGHSASQENSEIRPSSMRQGNLSSEGIHQGNGAHREHSDAEPSKPPVASEDNGRNADPSSGTIDTDHVGTAFPGNIEPHESSTEGAPDDIASKAPESSGVFPSSMMLLSSHVEQLRLELQRTVSQFREDVEVIRNERSEVKPASTSLRSNSLESPLLEQLLREQAATHRAELAEYRLQLLEFQQEWKSERQWLVGKMEQLSSISAEPDKGSGEQERMEQVAHSTSPGKFSDEANQVTSEGLKTLVTPEALSPRENQPAQQKAVTEAAPQKPMMEPVPQKPAMEVEAAPQKTMMEPVQQKPAMEAKAKSHEKREKGLIGHSKRTASPRSKVETVAKTKASTAIHILDRALTHRRASSAPLISSTQRQRKVAAMKVDQDVESEPSQATRNVRIPGWHEHSWLRKPGFLNTPLASIHGHTPRICVQREDETVDSESLDQSRVKQQSPVSYSYENIPVSNKESSSKAYHPQGTDLIDADQLTTRVDKLVRTCNRFQASIECNRDLSDHKDYDKEMKHWQWQSTLRSYDAPIRSPRAGPAWSPWPVRSRSAPPKASSLWIEGLPQVMQHTEPLLWYDSLREYNAPIRSPRAGPPWFPTSGRTCSRHVGSRSRSPGLITGGAAQDCHY